MFVCCEYCVLSRRGLCDELITRREESYRLWCVVVCDLETSRMRRPWSALGRSATKKMFLTTDCLLSIEWDQMTMAHGKGLGRKRPVILFQYSVFSTVRREIRSRKKPQWNSEWPVICDQILLNTNTSHKDQQQLSWPAQWEFWKWVTLWYVALSRGRLAHCPVIAWVAGIRF